MLQNLPTELVLEIMGYLANRVSDLASVARTSRRLHGLVNPLLHTTALATPNRYGFSITRRAVALGDNMLLQRLLLHGSRSGLDERHPITGTTALHGALMLEQCETVRILLSNGANVEIPDRKGWAAIHWAVLSGNCELAEEVLNNGGSPAWGTRNGGLSGTTPLHMAAARGDHEMVELLIRRGASLESRDQYRRRSVEFALGLLRGENGRRQRDLVKILAVDGGGQPRMEDFSWLSLDTKIMLVRWESVVWDERHLASRK